MASRFTNHENASGMPIHDHTSSNQAVSVTGIFGRVVSVSVSIIDLTHTFPDDLDFLLVAPDGKSNLAFWTDAGGGLDLSAVRLFFTDSAASALPDGDGVLTGTYRPSSYGAPETDSNWGTATGTINHAGPTGGATFASAFSATNPNGEWRLWVRDDLSGDVGNIVRWSISIGTESIGSDFNGDGRSDLLWRHSSGAVATWEVNNNTAAPNAFQAHVGTDWRVAGIGDFDGDFRSDLLWRHDNGSISVWKMLGNSATPNVFQAHVGNDWHVAAVGEFADDLTDDIIWRHDNGTISLWGMHPSTTGGVTTSPNVRVEFVGNEWHLVGAGNFDGDFGDDLLWRHDNGTLTTWRMNGEFPPNKNVFTAAVGTDWHIVGTGDFNGDGRDDLLWRHDNGTVTTWQMNAGGDSVSANVFTAFVGNDWRLLATGDYNADGKEDLLWRHDSGAISTWHMNGDTATPNVFQANVGLDWTIQTNQYDFV